MEIALMIEGQDGLTWPRWQRIAAAAEDLGFAGLYRSDHYTNANPPDKASLELWVSLTWLASHTSRIEFGPLVSPVSFRQPTMTARMAAAVDDLSRGRLQLGLGAGWQVREHANYGWDLLEVGPRLDRFEEGLEVITRLLHSDEPVDFEGDYYRLKEAVLLPRPSRPGGPPIVIGGNGERRTLPLVARYGDEWNGVFIDPSTFARLSGLLDGLLVEAGREPASVRRSLMVGCVYGNDEETLRRKAAAFRRTPEEARASGTIAVGGDAEMRVQLEAWAAAGVERIMLQWLELDDLDGLEGLARVAQDVG